MLTRRELANAVRALSMDAVQRANSGHPGAPMGMADFAEVFWNDFHSHNPANPRWANRDRFVLSNGHASMLIYAMLHLSGYDLTIEDIKNFRQFGSKTAGHPEYGVTPGVETTTGPLGQGIANAVGMALAERLLAARYNRPGHDIVDHRTWVFLGDGCMMEGVSHEACSLAGTLGLGKLVALYDDNGITIDGPTDGWFRDDTPGRFRAYGWHVVEGVDGHDPAAVAAAIAQAQAETARPSLVCCRTTIGFGAPNAAGKCSTHGAPLGEEEIAAARAQLGWTHAPFAVPADIYAAWDARAKGAATEAAWNQRFEAYAAAFPELAAEFTRRMEGRLPQGWDAAAVAWLADAAAKDPQATRKSSQQSLEALGRDLPELVGGSCDLAGSNGTKLSFSSYVAPGDFSGRSLHFGVREFGMSAIMNGLALHGGFIPYGATFLVFADYCRNAIRMAALMGLRCAWILTHDSIGVGEDGPTHQPIEHLASLRVIPNLHVWRPASPLETAVAWKCAIERTGGPAALSLTRQTLGKVEHGPADAANIARGGYVLQDCQGQPEAIVLATGSEISLALEAARALRARGRRVRVVSMPCCELFDAQDKTYRDAVLPPAVTARLSVEAGCTACWHKYVGSAGRTLGLDRFGESSPAKILFQHFGFTAQKVAEELEAML